MICLSARKVLIAILLTGVLAVAAAAPTAAAEKKFSSSGMPIASPPPAPPPQAISAKQQFNRYLIDAFGPIGWLRSAASAGISQATNDPPEWRQGMKGYGRRVGSKFGQHVIQETVLYGLSAPFGQDPTYYKCDCSGFGPRLGHAIISSFTALNRSEKRVFSVPRIIAPFAAGEIAANTWYPDRFGPKDGLRFGATSFATSIGVNIFKEFIFGGRQHP